jgi:hypothetical protein
MYRFANTLKKIMPIFNWNSTQEFLYSKEILIMAKNRISSLKISIWLFCCLSIKKRKYCLVTSRKKLNLLVPISKKVQFSLQKQFFNFFIPVYWFLQQNQLNQVHLISASSLKQINSRSIENMISLKRKRKRRAQKVLLQSHYPF